ncbi:MAG TPA: STAS domain-containing protein [Chthoniobacteraceae bacterium]|nr:STAS domain-containing protein [Chthoniobacteraceae bacterium]
MATFHTLTDGDIQILTVEGRIEPDNWKELKDSLATLVEQNPKAAVVVDLEKLEYIASSGFRELFLAGRHLQREGGSLAVCALKGEVARVFQLAGFATAYPIFETRDEALEAFRAKGRA